MKTLTLMAGMIIGVCVGLYAESATQQLKDNQVPVSAKVKIVPVRVDSQTGAGQLDGEYENLKKLFDGSQGYISIGSIIGNMHVDMIIVTSGGSKQRITGETVVHSIADSNVYILDLHVWNLYSGTSHIAGTMSPLVFNGKNKAEIYVKGNGPDYMFKFTQANPDTQVGAVIGYGWIKAPVK